MDLQIGLKEQFWRAMRALYIVYIVIHGLSFSIENYTTENFNVILLT